MLEDILIFVPWMQLDVSKAWLPQRENGFWSKDNSYQSLDGLKVNESGMYYISLEIHRDLKIKGKKSWQNVLGGCAKPQTFDILRILTATNCAGP